MKYNDDAPRKFAPTNLDIKRLECIESGDMVHGEADNWTCYGYKGYVTLLIQHPKYAKDLVDFDNFELAIKFLRELDRQKMENI